MTAMDRFERVGRYTVVLAAALLVAASAGSAQEKGTGEGIKVHGHWTIDVKNPDGTLASHHEFENALVQSGQSGLSSVLSHSATVVGWVVQLLGPNGVQLYETAEPQLNYLPNLSTLTVNTSNPQQVVLQGSAQDPAFSASITSVRTVLVLSVPNSPFWATNPFSERVLPQPIAVQANQIVQVTVVLSFS